MSALLKDMSFGDGNGGHLAGCDDVNSGNPGVSHVLIPRAVSPYQWEFGEQHWLNRLRQQKAMQDDSVRHPPSVFGTLEDGHAI